MSTVSRWVVPCYFSRNDGSAAPVNFYLTDSVRFLPDNGVIEGTYNENTGIKKVLGLYLNVRHET